jgi:predicted nucleic acid-binding protein
MNGRQIDCIADTSAVIALSRRDPKTIETLTNKNFAITFVTLAELSLGTLKASKPDAVWSRIQDVIRDRQMFHVTPVTPAIYARIYHDLEQRGLMIPINGI